MTLSDLLRARPDLKPYAQMFAALYSLHGPDFARAFNPDSELWAAEIHAGFNSTTNRMDEAA